MCGIVGVLGYIGYKEKVVFKQLLEIDSIRGRHSTGVFKVLIDGTVQDRKKAVDGFDFVKLESNFIINGDPKLMVGHNRWATKGEITDINAHPFIHDNIIGVHNGTLTSQYKLLDSQNFPVDSDNIFYHISKKGLDDALENMIGAYSIAMYNKNNSVFNLFRNKERPMHMCFSIDKNTMFFASELGMLHLILDRNDIKHGAMFTLVKDTILSINILDMAKDTEIKITYKKIPKLKVVPIKITYTKGYYNQIKKYVVDSPLKKIESKINSNSINDLDYEGWDELSFEDTEKELIINYWGNLITIKDWEYLGLSRTGCIICGDNINPIEDTFRWVTPKTVSCSYCNNYTRKG